MVLPEGTGGDLIDPVRLGLGRLLYTGYLTLTSWDQRIRVGKSAGMQHGAREQRAKGSKYCAM